MRDPLKLLVGDHYDSGIQRWPGSELILTTDGGLFLMSVNAPTSAQIAEFSASAMQFAWYDARYHGILCYRFGESPWQHYAFNPHDDTPPGTVADLPAIEPGQTQTFSFGLAEADRTTVLAVRKVQWPEHFVTAVRATVARLVAESSDKTVRIDENNEFHLFVGSERIARRAGVRCHSS
ncbi:hypothetical protein [Nocardia crassostreae]|uniref:hypothetical protein n=1 Tax=Nocardia crassostreae TaxID=53428 RepID=UPI000829F03D|nr:hypothetical protein [Nocardia crassostreae]